MKKKVVSKIISYFKITKALLPILLLTLVLVFSVGIADVSAVPGDNIYVNDTGGNDDFDGSDWTTAKKTIKNATNNVNPNGIVNIANGQYNGTNNTRITIDKNMTINGESQTGTIINGTGTNWIFTVTPGINLTLNNLTLTNATRTDGGAIYNYGNLTVTDCSFTSNNASLGGAIYNYGNLSVTDCSFTSNNAQFHAGAIYNLYGILSVTGCSFTGNNALIHAGAIYDQVGSLSIIDSSFIGNTATNAGAIYNHDSIVSVTGSSFIGNNAQYSGGAIYNYGSEGSVSVTGSSFIGNTATNGSAIYNPSTGTVIANFNRIVGNDIESYGSLDAEYNWWGTNFEGTDPVTAGRVTGTGIVVNKWLVLTITANPTSIINGETSTITADLLHDQNGVYQNPDNGHIPDKTPVTFNTDLGSVGSKTINKETTDGVATATLTADEAAGIAHVNSVVDIQTVNTEVNINPKSGLYLTITPNKNNPMVGETVIYVFKVGNKGPDTAKNVVMTYVVPEGLEFGGANVDVGSYTYDAATRTVTWTIGDVPVGDPYMWLSLKVLSSGTYIINPLLSTSTYDPTLNSNTQSLTFNAAATPGNNTNNNTNNNTVNAATNTVTMQETGIPIILLIMALFMVIGGLVSSKK